MAKDAPAAEEAEQPEDGAGALAEAPHSACKGHTSCRGGRASCRVRSRAAPTSSSTTTAAQRQRA
jgi:hypothetical protein